MNIHLKKNLKSIRTLSICIASVPKHIKKSDEVYGFIPMH